MNTVHHSVVNSKTPEKTEAHYRSLSYFWCQFSFYWEKYCLIWSEFDKMVSYIIFLNSLNIYLFQVNNSNIRKRCEICSMLIIKTPERRQWRRSGVFIVNFKHISHLFLVFLLLAFLVFLWLLWTVNCSVEWLEVMQDQLTFYLEGVSWSQICVGYFKYYLLKNTHPHCATYSKIPTHVVLSCLV